MHAELDKAEQHIGSAPTPFYEGKLVDAQRFGPMTSLQFSDGKIFDVSKAPSGLSEGDIVRIYKADDAYEAHLWHSAEPDLPSAESNALAPAIKTSAK